MPALARLPLKLRRTSTEEPGEALAETGRARQDVDGRDNKPGHDDVNLIGHSQYSGKLCG